MSVRGKTTAAKKSAKTVKVKDLSPKKEASGGARRLKLREPLIRVR